MDDLFAPTQTPLLPSPRLIRVTCCGCGMTAVTPDGAAPLCQICAEDLDATRAHIAGLRASCEARRRDAEQAYRDAVASAPPFAREQMTRIADGWPRTKGLLHAALGAYAPLASLARAWQAWQHTIGSTASMLARCETFGRHFPTVRTSEV